MNSNYKPGGGNKPQPYIPAGHGDKSGEYTNKEMPNNNQQIKNLYIKNISKKYNFLGSKLVEKVTNYYCYQKGVSLPIHSKPNTVIKKVINGYVVMERYYNNKGVPYLDIHYTCHGNPKTHPIVPHIHRWVEDENGNINISQWEEFQ